MCARRSSPRIDAVDTVPQPQRGDWVEVTSPSGGAPRRGQILDVLGPAERPHYRVRWDEEHVSLFYPADHTVVIRRESEA